MNEQRMTEEKIVAGLHRLPDKNPPSDLRARIMDGLPRQNDSRFVRLWKKMNQYLTPPVVVGPALVTAALAMAFFGGMRFESSLQRPALVDDPAGITMTAGVNEAEASFYLGRSLMASGQAMQALEAFDRALLQSPDNPRYVLWQAAAYYALGDVERERSSYERLIQKRPDFLPARLNLANNLLQTGQVEQAGELYEQVLSQAPSERTALYNRAITLHLQHRRQEENRAWKTFLQQYRTGVWAQRAMQHLQENGDYAFRSYVVGQRPVIVNQELLLGGASRERDTEIEYLADLLQRQGYPQFNIVVFQENQADQAGRTARSLRKALLRRLPPEEGGSIRISWFGEPEKIRLADGQQGHLSKGLLIFSTPEKKKKEEHI